MLVVIAIIGLVSALALPLFTTLMRAGKLGQGEDIVKSACLVARSRAILERRRFSVTLLEAERCVIVNDYDLLRNVLPVKETGQAAGGSATTLVRDGKTASWTGYYVTLASGTGLGQQRRIDRCDSETLTVDVAWTPQSWNPSSGDYDWKHPMAGDRYVIGGKDAAWVCPHYLGNYADEQQRYEILSTFAVDRVRTLPEGCRFDLDRDNSDPNTPEPQGWTYIFLPTGGAWTLTTEAVNERNDEHWCETTYMPPPRNRPSGPVIYAPRDRDSATVVVFAMSGQAVTE